MNRKHLFDTEIFCNISLLINLTHPCQIIVVITFKKQKKQNKKNLGIPYRLTVGLRTD